jgi:RNA polymerase sigma-70 factor (ECF subfamily)
LNDRDLSEDVAQEAFAGLWEKREEFTSEKAAKAWLFTVVRHKALNHIRHQKVVSKTLPQLEGDETQCLNVSA